ncbi:MAG: DUF1015 domain-containing protein [Saprospiraceae bacterium]|nr:DUF1015 domain-containing protein [Saprospiraceae bacterium]
MSIFLPFRAIRPLKKHAKDVACRPYDVLNAKEAKEESKGNPISFYHVIKPEIDFPEDIDPYSPEIYTRGKQNFDELMQRGILVQESKSAFYLYQLNMNGHEQTGLVGCCSIDDYFDNVIKKHELTRTDKEEDRKNHIRTSKLNYEPVFFAYPSVGLIDRIVKSVKKTEPVYDFLADDGIRHKAWVISEPSMLEEITDTFKSDVPDIYIADGHHRTSANAEVGRELRNVRNGKPCDGGRDNYFLAVLFPDHQLQILDYNRVVKDLNGLSESDLLRSLSKNFIVERKQAQYKPETLHTFGMYLNNQWFKLTARENTFVENDPIGQLDVTILSKNILEPLFDIVDLRNDKRIDFVGGMRGLGELEKRVDSGEMKVAFSMFPVSIQQIINISDNDLIMPPKVTWFEPKLRSGLFVHKLDQ